MALCIYKAKADIHLPSIFHQGFLKDYTKFYKNVSNIVC